MARSKTSSDSLTKPNVLPGALADLHLDPPLSPDELVQIHRFLDMIKNSHLLILSQNTQQAYHVYQRRMMAFCLRQYRGDPDLFLITEEKVLAFLEQDVLAVKTLEAGLPVEKHLSNGRIMECVHKYLQENYGIIERPAVKKPKKTPVPKATTTVRPVIELDPDQPVVVYMEGEEGASSAIGGLVSSTSAVSKAPRKRKTAIDALLADDPNAEPPVLTNEDGTPKHYRMNRHLRSVSCLWKEWSSGYQNGPSVKTLEETFGPNWCQDRAERAFFEKRKKVVDLVYDVARARQVTEVEASAIIDQYMKDNGIKSVSAMQDLIKRNGLSAGSI